MQVRTAFSTCLRISHRQPGTTFRMYSRCQTRVVSLVGRRTELLAHQLLQDKAIAVDAKWMIRSLVPSPCVHQASQNGPDDRAGLSKFSIRKRTIPRFGPSDCSLRCLALLRTQIFSDSVDEELYSSAFRTTVYIKFLFIHEQLSQIAQDAPSSTFMELFSADVCQFLLTKMTGQCVSSW